MPREQVEAVTVTTPDSPVDVVKVDVVVEPSGPPGPAGTPGPGVPDAGVAGQMLCKISDADYDTAWMDQTVYDTYRFVQAAASTSWHIYHYLPYRPNVSVVDSTGRAIVPGAIDYPSGHTVVLTFNPAVGGEAYLS